jgi:hypothetical protein
MSMAARQDDKKGDAGKGYHAGHHNGRSMADI